MSLNGKSTLWFWLIVFAIAALMLLLFHASLWPFAAGLILAFILDPIADRLQRLGCSRGVAVMIVFGAIILLITLIVVLLLPLLVQQVSQFIEQLPSIVKAVQNFINTQIGALREAVGPQISERLRSLQNPLETFTQDSAKMAGGFLAGLLVGGSAVFNVVSLLIVTPIVGCYMLYDWDRMVAIIDKLLPRRDVRSVRSIAREMNTVLAAYLRGQALICVILGSIYAFGLVALGLNFGLLIGIGSGLICFIPYVGNTLGLGTALLVGLSQYGPDFWPLASIAAVYITGQLIDAYVLQPRFLGKAVGIHPVWLLFALYAFGSLFGFAGVFLAVPMAACLGVIVRHIIRYYQTTQLYGTNSKATKIAQAPQKRLAPPHAGSNKA